MSEEALYQLQQNERYAILGESNMMAGTVKNPSTGMWQTWLSMANQSLVNVSAHHQREEAEQVVIALGEAYRNKDLDDTDTANAMIESLAHQADSEPSPLPEETLHEIEELLAQARGGAG